MEYGGFLGPVSVVRVCIHSKERGILEEMGWRVYERDLLRSPELTLWDRDDHTISLRSHYDTNTIKIALAHVLSIQLTANPAPFPLAAGDWVRIVLTRPVELSTPKKVLDGELIREDFTSVTIATTFQGENRLIEIPKTNIDIIIRMERPPQNDQ